NAVYRELMSLVTISTERGIEIDHARALQLLNQGRVQELMARFSKEDLSAAVQKFAEETVMTYLRPLVEKSGARKICLSGGVTANVILNQRIYRELAEEVFIVPAMADDGAAQGAAILQLLARGHTPASLRWLGEKKMPYWGTCYTAAEARRRIDQFAAQCKTRLTATDASKDWPEEAAAAICRGEVGAIFHGRMEWGPRALGNRSIIADARNPKIRDILNRDIKNRPSFQPFCPSMLAEERERLFGHSYQNPHMTIAFDLKREFWETLPGAIHIDGTSRVQFVTEEDNANYYRLLRRVKEITGYGVIINTSFNKHGRTIVESPEDALQDFLDSKLDFVVIEGHFVRKATQASTKPGPRAVGIIFSKDRAMQLDATLRSFAQHCHDAASVPLKVLHTASTPEHATAYAQLAAQHPSVEFVREQNFKADFLGLARGAENIVLMVDDCLFIRNFVMTDTVQALNENPDSIGCSLRLGRNTTFCYPLNQPQQLPDFTGVNSGLLKHRWTAAQHDFGYPLEVSSSVYRGADLLPLLEKLDYQNPNTLEAALAANAAAFSQSRPALLCHAQSVAFCAPLNVVQSVYPNRKGANNRYTASALAQAFLAGQRIDLASLANFVPNGCHQEIELHFTSAGGGSAAKPAETVAVSVVIPCYNQAHFLREAVGSVLGQSFTDWEAIIVNDGSKDDTSTVAKAIISENPSRKITLVEKPNGGLSDARNAGIHTATGKYVLPLDADDLIQPEFLAKTVSVLEANPRVSIAYTDVEQFGVRNEIWRTRDDDPKLVLNNTRHAYCALFRRGVWETVGGYNRNMVWGYEDWDFWVGCFEHGLVEQRVPEPLMRYRTKAESMVTRALQHDEELRAQIVKNHPSLYDATAIAWADKVLTAARNRPAPASGGESIPALLDSAGALFRTGDLRGVQLLLTRAVAIEPDNGEIWESLGSVTFQLGEHRLALEQLEKAASLRPNHPEAHVKLAMAALELERIEQFEASLARALALEPENSSALRLIANLNLQAGNHVEAARGYSRLLSLNPVDLEALLALGKCFFETNDLSMAKLTYERALALDPKNQIALENLEVLERQAETSAPETSKSSSKSAHVESLAPATLEGCLQAAETYFAAGNLAAACEPLREATLLAPDNTQIIETLGSLLFQTNDLEAARVEFRLLTSLAPFHVPGHVKLAHTAVRLGAVEEFEQSLSKALELDPENRDALQLLADLNREQKRFGDAARIYARLLQGASDEIPILFSLGYCFYQAGEFDSARLTYERILELDANNAEARQNLALLSGQSLPAAASPAAVANDATQASGARRKRPVISVVLPTYNRPEILARCLGGFAAQTLSKDEFEVVIVDDGSQPPVAETVNQFGQSLRIVYHYQENAGLSAARNACIERASAAWLALHDDDDVPAPDYLARCVEFHRCHPEEADILLAQLAPAPELPKTPVMEWAFNPANSVIGFPNPSVVHDFSRFYGGTSSCKASLFTYCRYDSEYRFGFEDMEFAYRLNDKVRLRVHYLPEVISHLIRPIDFNALYRRLYREGRSLRRCHERHGDSVLRLMPPGMNQSVETLARIEPHVPALFSMMEKLGPDGANPEVTFNLDGKVLRGREALHACYSLLARHSRARGWVDFSQGRPESEGLAEINGRLESRGQTTAVAAPPKPASAARRALVYFHSNPYPARSGAHRRCLCLLDGLRELGYEITLASSDLFTDQPWNDESIFGLKRSHGVSARIHFATPADRRHASDSAKRDALWDLYTPPGLVKHFRELFAELSPELVVINYAYCSGLVAAPEFARVTKIVEMHDLVTLSGGMARAAAAELPAPPLAPSSVALRFLDERFYDQLALTATAEEYRCYASFDGVSAISPIEQNLVSQHAPGVTTAWLPVAFPVLPVENTYAEDPLLVAFANPFNLQGCLYFAERVLPKVRRAFIEFQLRVAGDACRHLAPTDGLDLLGYVPDLKPLYAASAFAVCPLIGGTGQQVKIVEAMAHGLAVVTLRNVAASSPVEHGVNGFIADDAEEFASYVITLYRDPALCRKMGSAARKTIAEQHSFAAWTRRLGDLINRANAARRGRAGETVQPEAAAPPAPVTAAPVTKNHVQRPVRWLAPFFNPSGYASEAINFVVPLAGRLNLGIHHHNRIFSEAFVAGLAEGERATLFRLRDHCASLRGGIVISESPADGFARPADAEYLIGRTMFEAEGLPPGWLSQCNLMDEIWVPSQFNLESFAAAGVPREKLVVMPAAVDETVFDPARQTPLALPNRAKFNFLAIFEWTSRKGWDALLAAYLREFSASDDVCLYLRTYLINQPDGDPAAAIWKQVREFGATLGLGDKSWPHIEILAGQIPAADLPGLYRAADCLVCPSRGEGWGRPHHEAMMMGLPVIATNWSGNTEFMSAETAYPLDYDLVEASQLEHELWLYRGHRWANPRVDHLRQLMRHVAQHPDEAARKGAAARAHVVARFGRAAVAARVLARLAEIDHSLSVSSCPPATIDTFKASLDLPAIPASRSTPVSVAWAGSYLDLGSLSHVNRELTRRLDGQPGIRLTRVGKNIIPPEHAKTPLLQETGRLLRAQVPNHTQVTVRHSWPPVWDTPVSGAWIMIQPWEYGILPAEWVRNLGRVDEVWAYSNYIRRVYIDSGVDPAKVKVVPLGIDPAKFRPDAPPLALATSKRFKILFVGGTIHRKGPDLLLKAYLESFTAADDVCLVIKDFGGQSVYSGQTLEEQIRAAQGNPHAPEILHLTAELSPEELPGLYTACDCLAHPYRGEGFALPVLEAMACGLPVVVTAGGSTDDFATDEFAYRLPASRSGIGDRVGDFALVRNGWVLEPDLAALGEKLRWLVTSPAEAKARGVAASEHVRNEWTWAKSAKIAAARIHDLVARLRKTAEQTATRRARQGKPIALPATARVANLMEARQNFVARKLPAAWENTLAALRERPFHPEAWLLLAEIAAAGGDFALARRCAERALHMAPNLRPARQFLKSLRNGTSSSPAADSNFVLLEESKAPRLTVCMIVKNEEKFL
ncbi:MAG TPA: carbamoyltransferase C-terminal domain-containing protein, partial [Verrucomicrobiae bacterium]|nr:carbamoyltransferase C-terminal domain-containing protein [Verrucomicrobiae bacterium]